MLKKLIAILLLASHLFNLGGYSLVFHYFIRQSDRQFAVLLDQHQYAEAELLQISIPLHLPYMQGSSHFERVDGSIEHNGTHYNYVKRRVYNDTLYIMCIPNHQKTQLAKEKSTYAGEVNDFAANKKQKESTAKKACFSAEYSNIITRYGFAPPAIVIKTPGHAFSCYLGAIAIDIPERPPQHAC